jgi:hypothetical protein
MSIQTFVGNHIAIFRRVKKTYSILHYNHQRHHWSRLLLDPDLPITIGTQAITPADVKIAIDMTQRFIDCKASGKYLRYGQVIVPIIEKKANSPRNFPNGIFAGEIVCVTQNTEQFNMGPLWILKPLPLMQTIEPMPRRIAWIIAEDAARNNDDCPIMLNPISPITASVTSCYHVFSTDSIHQWLQTHNTCPVCKKVATAVPCFTD